MRVPTGKARTWTFIESVASLSNGRTTCLSNMSKPVQKNIADFLGLFPSTPPASKLSLL